MPFRNVREWTRFVGGIEHPYIVMIPASQSFFLLGRVLHRWIADSLPVSHDRDGESAISGDYPLTLRRATADLPKAEEVNPSDVRRNRLLQKKGRDARAHYSSGPRSNAVRSSDMV